jgi:hypothetical protein
MVTHSDTQTSDTQTGQEYKKTLFVTTALDIIEKQAPHLYEIFGEKPKNIPHRRLTPLFFFWIRFQINNVSNLYQKKKIPEDTYNYLNQQYLKIYKYASGEWGVKNIKSEKFFAKIIQAHFEDNKVNDIAIFEAFPDYHKYPGFGTLLITKNIFPANGVFQKDYNIQNYLELVRKYFPEYAMQSNLFFITTAMKLLLQYANEVSDNPTAATEYRIELITAVMAHLATMLESIDRAKEAKLQQLESPIALS